MSHQAACAFLQAVVLARCGNLLCISAIVAGRPFAASLSHPRLTGVDFATDFAPFKCVLWANGNTLSLEPFLALNLAPGESREWTLTYDFGAAR